HKLEGKRSSLQITFSLIFIVVALLLLMAAVWFGMTLASRLARPIMSLIDAADKVRGGDLSARVLERAGDDELGSLIRSFNRMAERLGLQQEELVGANRELDERRRFTETVLGGVSAGVVGMDREANIHLPNPQASTLLETDLQAMIGRPLVEAWPELGDMVEIARGRPDRMLQREIHFSRNGRAHTFLARLAAESLDGDVIGYVLTFDDITELQSAQRTAAWADVARRIAHEIKNPLTPIQLSAERLKRKYLKEIESDPETFVRCTDTIGRQVEEIRRMVNEFSEFARMPAPSMADANLTELVSQAVFLQRTGFPDITFETIVPDVPVRQTCDANQVGRVLTNVLKNAAEAIHGREPGESPDAGPPPGLIRIRLIPGEKENTLIVEDNGRGLPEEGRDRLTEPYVTTRAKGTGLGLAIVKKIMEDHGGSLVLGDAEGGGARVILTFATDAAHGS
ncbi:MAG: HAMP domain-containing protein, partial [Alphaproteobacteria bacterium]|nr:HAMP domain-containing protein [Alphaproteobacteria bacterium]